jgi:hypothetical protein
MYQRNVSSIAHRVRVCGARSCFFTKCIKEEMSIGTLTSDMLLFNLV